PGKDSLDNKVGVLTFNIQDLPHSLVASILSCEGAVGVRNGCFCAHPYVKGLLKFDEADAKAVTAEILGGNRTNLPGMVRASFGCYNNTDDIDRLAEMLHVAARKEYKGRYRLDAASGSYWPEGFHYPLRDYFPFLSFTEATVSDTYTGKS
ncbi:MAG: aminotransferase class V-fold PLP-dependent enzyme, partial [Chlorobi bacterium]|nr:aminotransferase class V-fold PLP-dependent enzyme [Chlorobiota bacterium]